MISSQGLKVTWGTCTITATSLRYSSSAQGEVDITSNLSRTAADPTYPNRKVIYKSVDYFAVDPGEVSMEFQASASSGPNGSRIGHQAVLTISSDDAAAAGYEKVPTFTAYAFLTQYGVDFAVGDVVKGNLTFKLSDT